MNRDVRKKPSKGVQMNKLTLIAVLCLMWGCGTQDDANSTEPHGDIDTRIAIGKADNPEQRESTSLADEFDYCGAFELYGDGTCQDFCWEVDPDCENIDEDDTEDATDIECDDSDCESEDIVEDEETPLLSDEEIEGLCSRFRNTDDRERELAESLCIDREGDAFEACVDNCLRAFADG